ncbi:LTA synthase family protein [Pontibacter sp. CAU 1760]
MFDLSFKLLLRRLALLLGLYLVLRAVFYLLNYSAFAEAGFTETMLAFLHGFRFDVAAILVINSLFVLLSLLPVNNILHPRYQRTLKWVYLLSNAPFIALALADTEFFKFIGRRSGSELFSIAGDITEQTGQLLQYYWYLGVGFIFLLVALFKVYPKAHASQAPQAPVWVRSLRLLLVGGFMVLGIRGGLQLKPLRPSHAFILEPAALGHLSLNTPFTFIKSVGQTQLNEKHYFPSDQALLSVLSHTPAVVKANNAASKKENIIIIVLESFAAEYVGTLNNGQGYTPFLDSLATQGVLFRNAFANGRKSIEALPSILAGIPSLMDQPFITSPYQANRYSGLGSLLQRQGYRTAMFHGAANGSMGFNNFAKTTGMQAYYGLDEYPAERWEQDYDGQWGIFDEPYLQYVAQELTTLPQPFMALAFTLSSHQPYTIPVPHKGRFPKGELEIHESIGYADYALRAFFEKAAQQPWYNNTLFILTADHTQKSIAPAYQNELGHYRVPLLLFHPGQNFQAINPDRVTQHADILPTVVDYLNLPTKEVLPFGQSVLDTSNAGKALLFNGHAYFLVQPEQVTELTLQDEVRFYTFPEMGPAPPAPNAEQQLKAYVQYFRNGMLSNNLYLWRK